MSLNLHAALQRLPALMLVPALLACGCARVSTGDAEPDAGSSATSPDDFMDLEDLSPEEERAIKAGKAFIVALAARNYDAAYAELSSHARARMTAVQFDAPNDETEATARQAEAVENATAADFAKLMERVEARYGPPHSVEMLYVESTDPAVLSGKNHDFETALAIGMMPESIPAGIRRAALRGQVRTRFTPEQLQQTAAEMGVTPAELEQDDEVFPYYNLKYVMVEENGTLKVGWFEFMPPSILD